MAGAGGGGIAAIKRHLIDVLTERVRAFTDHGDTGAVLDPAATAHARQLTELVNRPATEADEDHPDSAALLALGWLYWCRYLALPAGRGGRDLTTCLALFARAIAAAADADLPDPVRDHLGTRAVQHPHQQTATEHIDPTTIGDNFGLHHTANPLDQLDAAVDALYQSVGRTSPGHPDRAGRLNTLGVALLARFERTGRLADLDAAVTALREVVDGTPADHPARAALLNNLGNALQTRFERTGQVADLDAAVTAARQAVDGTPADHPDRAGRLDNLGLALGARFERTGQQADLDAAVTAARQAVDGTPADQASDRPSIGARSAGAEDFATADWDTPQRRRPPTLAAGAPRAEASYVPAPEPPVKAWPRVDAPDEVAVGATFTATIGLGTVLDPALQVLSADQLPTHEDVLVTVVVDGFELISGALEFTVNFAGEPARELMLRAMDDPALRAERTIGVRYTVGGALRAYAMREVLVNGATPAPPGTFETAPPGEASDLPLAGADRAAPTLVLTVQQGSDLDGRSWQWTITSETVPLPPAAPDELRTTLDETAQQLQAMVVQEGSRSTGATLFDRLVAIGKRLAEQLPEQVVRALNAASAATAPEPPTVLLISSEARIPWELTVLHDVPDDCSPFLCGQVQMGRWVMGRRGKPASPPHSEKSVTSRAVVVGDYAGLLTVGELPQAEVETAAMVADGAHQLAAEYSVVRAAVHGTPPVDVLHFATHGRFVEGLRDEGVVLVDRSGAQPREVYFTPMDVEAGNLPTEPFVFLNACQVGAGETILGDYAGMAAAFLRIGATAVVAPLWAVDDGLAATAATDFYRATDSGVTVGAAVGALRAKCTPRAAADPRTAKYGSFLAYQYFGHPNLTLRNGP